MYDEWGKRTYVELLEYFLERKAPELVLSLPDMANVDMYALHQNG